MTDILAAIDATVDGLCACGCGAILDPAGPSGWFATQGCQQRFQARDATAPEEVWYRSDAAPVYVQNDAARVPLSSQCCEAGAVAWPGSCLWHALDGLILHGQPEQEVETRVDPLSIRQQSWGEAWERVIRFGSSLSAPATRLPPPEPPSTWDAVAARRLRAEAGWSLANDGPLAWMRRCGTCGRDVRPLTGPMLPPVRFVAEQDIADLLPSPEVAQFCLRCHTRWPGPPLLAQWREEPNQPFYVLRLSAPGWCRSTSRLDMYDVEAAAVDVVSWTWREMELGLLEALTFRARCDMAGCREKARARFRVREHVTVLGSLAGDVGLCPRHESDLLRATDGWGRPLVDWVHVAPQQPPGCIAGPTNGGQL